MPLGGIGCGSIGRGFKGEFGRFQMIPGMYKWKTIPGDQVCYDCIISQSTVKATNRCQYCMAAMLYGLSWT